MATPGDKFVAQSAVPGVGSMEVIYRFIQPGFLDMPDLPMYDLIVDIPGHPAGSTLSRRTLEDLGYTLSHDAP